MSDLTNQILTAVVQASPEKKSQALAVLRGEAVAGAAQGWQAPEPFVTLKDVAAFLAVAPRTVQRWNLPFHRMSTRVRYRLSEVLDFLGGMKAEGLYLSQKQTPE
jgi:hypothetical protein